VDGLGTLAFRSENPKDFRKSLNRYYFIYIIYADNMNHSMPQTILKYFRQKGGYAHMKDLRAASFQTRDIAHLVQTGSLEKIKSGLYRLTNLPELSKVGLSKRDVCQAIPAGVICLASALEFHSLTTFIPKAIYVAIPRSTKPPRLPYPPVKVFYFSDAQYLAGIDTLQTAAGPVKVYCAEKTICDMFRYRNKLGEDLALEGLKEYLGRRGADLGRLLKYAEICRVKKILTPYLRIMVHS
jgi:hypothetical protein